ncbi:membrane protein [Frankia sp. R43]|uniref:glycosyltransferase family 87 protein n=1 Tax=Frankia sp. R43 TaxID=269536 RepID=UPI0006C9EAC0|nr:glycosyltransferase 87 family protein [Frankia sp. R43]KPM52855.1 membrane protein [Frankia sp. R43]
MTRMATTPALPTRSSPAQNDPVVAGASELIGGPPGRHAVVGTTRTWWSPLRVLMLFVVITCVLGYAQKSGCRDTRNWTDEYQYTRMCYSDVVALYSQEGLVDGKIPYLDYPTEYPPLIGAAMQLVSSFAGLGSAPVAVFRTEGGPPGAQVFDHYSMDTRSALFYDFTALLFLIAACVAVACTAMTAGQRRVWDAALLALAPMLALHLLTNWDILAVAFAAGGLLAWSRRAPRLAGILFGLGIVTKLYPVFFLVGLAALCLRAGRLRPLVRSVLYAAGTVVGVLLPVWLTAGYFNGTDKVSDGIWSTFWGGGNWTALLDGEYAGGHNGLQRFFELNSERGADWDSLAFALSWAAGKYDTRWFAPAHLVVMLLGLAAVGALAAVALRNWPWRAPRIIGAAAVCWLLVAIATPLLLTAVHKHGIPVGTLNAVTAVALILAVAGVIALALLAPRRPRVPQVVLLLVIAFLLTNKVFSPQYTIWLLPLVALARPRWRLFLLWQACEIWVLFTRFMHFIFNDTSGADGIDRGWFVGAVVLRDLVLCVLAAFVVSEILRPERDVVRADGLDDPAGGVLDGAPDVRGGRLGARTLLPLRRGAWADSAAPSGPEDPAGAARPAEAADVAGSITSVHAVHAVHAVHDAPSARSVLSAESVLSTESVQSGLAAPSVQSVRRALPRLPSILRPRGDAG